MSTEIVNKVATKVSGQLFRDIFFIQERIGKNGVPFRIYKIRTMKHGADKEIPECILNGEDKKSDDPRILPRRRWMRRCGIDEIPQIVNIVKGEMAVFGPRPQPASQYDNYSKRQQRERGRVKPGIFGNYALYYKGIKKRSLMECDDIYLLIRRRKERQGKPMIFFNAWIFTNAIKAILQGANR